MKTKRLLPPITSLLLVALVILGPVHGQQDVKRKRVGGFLKALLQGRLDQGEALRRKRLESRTSGSRKRSDSADLGGKALRDAVVVTGEDMEQASRDEASLRPGGCGTWVDRGVSHPRTVFREPLVGFDPGWRMPEVGEGREVLEVETGAVMRLHPDANHFVSVLLEPFLALGVAEVAASAEEARRKSGTTYNGGRKSSTQVVEGPFFFDAVQDMTDRFRQRRVVHRIVLRADLFDEGRFAPEIRTPEMLRQVVELLAYAWRNAHWKWIEEVESSREGDEIQCRVRGIAWSGASSYYQEDGSLGGVGSSQYCFEMRFILSTETGEVVLHPLVLDDAGKHHELVQWVNLTTGAGER